MPDPVILVVDDDPDIRDSLVELLSEEGFLSLGVANGRDALTALRNHSGIRLVLLDWMMPVMDGTTFLLEQAKEPRLAQVPVVVVTAAGRSHLQGVGDRLVLAKPLQLATLLEVVSKYCGRDGG